MVDFSLNAKARNDLGKVRAAACVVTLIWFPPSFTVVTRLLRTLLWKHAN